MDRADIICWGGILEEKNLKPVVNIVPKEQRENLTREEAEKLFNPTSVSYVNTSFQTPDSSIPPKNLKPVVNIIPKEQRKKLTREEAEKLFNPTSVGYINMGVQTSDSLIPQKNLKPVVGVATEEQKKNLTREEAEDACDYNAPIGYINTSVQTSDSSIPQNGVVNEEQKKNRTWKGAKKHIVVYGKSSKEDLHTQVIQKLDKNATIESIKNDIKKDEIENISEENDNSVSLLSSSSEKDIVTQTNNCDVLVNIGDNNYEACYKGSGLGYYYKSDGHCIRFTDFIVEIYYKEEKYGRKGKIEDSYIIKLTNDFGKTKEMIVPENQWMDLKTQIERQAPEFQIFADQVRNANKRVLSLILKFQRIPIKNIYAYWGWGKPNYGQRRFYHGGLPDCQSVKILPPSLPPNSQERFNILSTAWSILNVGDHKVVVPLILYSLASYMDAIFTDANHPLSHCMMAVGASGTMKTSFAKVIFSPFVSENERLYTVRSTEASLNVLHEKCYDDTLVVDDFNLEGSQAEINAKMRNIRALIRTYSDKTPRAKYGGNDNVKQYEIRGGCVFTGETRLTGQLKSGELRYIKVFFKKCLKGEVLKQFQNNPHIWSSFVAEFIRYLEGAYGAIVIFTKSSFEHERDKIINISEPRLIDALLHLRIVSHFVLAFLEREKILTRDQYEEWYNYFCQILHQVVSEQEDEAQIQEPYIQYLSEFFNLIGTGKLRVAPNLNTYVLGIKDYVGYADDENQIWMIKKDEAYKAIKEAFAVRNDYLAITVDEVSKLLKNAGLTKCDKNSCLKKAPDKIQGRPRMLAIIPNNCYALLHEIEQAQYQHN